MKKIVLAIATALCLSLLAFSQDASSSQSTDTQQGSSAQSSQTSNSSQSTDQSTSGMHHKKAGKAKLKHLKGTIGQDGKTFTTDKGNKSWTIMNPEAVQGHEGHHVILDAHVYRDKDSVHVMGVKMMGETGSKSKTSDKSSQQPMSEQPQR